MPTPNPPQTPLSSFWAHSPEEILSLLKSSKDGLSEDDAKDRLKEYGPNTIKSNAKSSDLELFLSQFKSPITILLLVAAGLSMFLDDKTDAIIIFVIVMISAILGFWQERGASNAVSQLLKMVQIKCKAIRGGQEVDVETEDIVPGDIILVDAGDIIPGDCIIIESNALYADEAAFTGETFPVEKSAGVVDANATLSKRSNCLLMGSHIISGTAKALVVKTAKDTEFGKISERLASKTPETDFEKGIRHFGYLLMEITLILVIIIFAINVFLHKPILNSFLFSLALAVGLTPQLLPAIITINLSTGARRMAKLQVIVKRLSSIENLGSMNVLCSDKTGTITDGKVKVNAVLSSEGKASDKALYYVWLNASLQKGFTNPLDQAICEFYKGKPFSGKIINEIPYDFIRKRLTVIVNVDGKNLAITKGAFNNVLEVCDKMENANGEIVPLDGVKDQVESEYEQLGNSGFRTLGISYKEISDTDFDRNDESGMTFLGFVTLFDPLKPDAAATIASLKTSGVSLKIITGDNALIAGNLATQVGIKNPTIITGSQMQDMSTTAFVEQVLKADIFAEVEPNQKEQIILALKKSNNVVGFMGDGINDAPALHAADVGISVNTAVDVAKEAADIVLLDSDLSVLEAGIIEGRKTFANTMKYIFMATSANFGNMFSMAGASLLLPFLPLLPKQILLTNLLTDFPEMAIASDSVDQESIAKPQKWNLDFIKRFMVVFGLLSSVFDYITFGVLLYVFHANEALFQTGWFTESVISATLIVLVVRTKLPFTKSKPGKYLTIATFAVLAFVLILPYITPIASLFGFIKLPLSFYGWIVLIVTAYILSAELAKRWFYKRYDK